MVLDGSGAFRTARVGTVPRAFFPAGNTLPRRCWGKSVETASLRRDQSRASPNASESTIRRFSPNSSRSELPIPCGPASG